jgi:Ran GTPase-activating protein 1
MCEHIFFYSLTCVNFQDASSLSQPAFFLTSLNLSGQFTGNPSELLKFGASAIGSLARSIGINSTLQVLDLRWRGLTTADVMELARALKTNQTLTQLNLSNNNSIKDEGARALADALYVNQHLRNLQLAHANVGDIGGTALMQMLHQNTALLELNLDVCFLLLLLLLLLLILLLLLTVALD